MPATARGTGQDEMSAPARAAKRGRPSRADLASRVGAREALLKATSDLMIAKDSVDFSLSEVAEMTGQSPALVKYYFGSKEGLLLALIELDAAEAVEQLRQLRAMDLPAVTKLRMHIGGLVNAYFRAPYGNRLLHTLTQDASLESAQYVAKIFLQPIADLQRELLAKGVEEGVIKAIDPMHFYFMVLGACDQFFSRRGALSLVFGQTEITKEMKVSYARTVTDVVLNGLTVHG